MMAIDDLLDRGHDARRRRDEAANELAPPSLKALEGLAGVELLDATQKRERARLRDRPRTSRRRRRRRRAPNSLRAPPGPPRQPGRPAGRSHQPPDPDAAIATSSPTAGGGLCPESETSSGGHCSVADVLASSRDTGCAGGLRPALTGCP
jgi:hypothetical protein